MSQAAIKAIAEAIIVFFPEPGRLDDKPRG